MLKRLSQCLLFLSISSIFLCSCSVGKHLPYFKDLPDSSAQTKLNTPPYTPLVLQADDELQITISNSSPEASQFFNMTSATPLSSVAGSTTPNTTSPTGGVAGSPMVQSSSQNLMNLYRIAPTGQITLPTLKDIQAAGLTIEQLKANILDSLKPYLKDAVVMIRLTNFRVTVIGEVGRPVVVPVNGQTINVLEAIGAAGDMTVFGIRRNVRVIHKLADGTTEVGNLNFNKSEVFSSKFFQLKQNDIVYITPSKNKSIAGSQTGIWVSIFSALASITVIFLTRTK